MENKRKLKNSRKKFLDFGMLDNQFYAVNILNASDKVVQLNKGKKLAN